MSYTYTLPVDFTSYIECIVFYTLFSASALNWWYVYLDPLLKAALTTLVPPQNIGKNAVPPCSYSFAYSTCIVQVKIFPHSK